MLYTVYSSNAVLSDKIIEDTASANGCVRGRTSVVKYCWIYGAVAAGLVDKEPNRTTQCTVAFSIFSAAFLSFMCYCLRRNYAAGKLQPGVHRTTLPSPITSATLASNGRGRLSDMASYRSS